MQTKGGGGGDHQVAEAIRFDEVVGNGQVAHVGIRLPGGHGFQRLPRPPYLEDTDRGIVGADPVGDHIALFRGQDLATETFEAGDVGGIVAGIDDPGRGQIIVREGEGLFAFRGAIHGRQQIEMGAGSPDVGHRLGPLEGSGHKLDLEVEAPGDVVEIVDRHPRGYRLGHHVGGPVGNANTYPVARVQPGALFRGQGDGRGRRASFRRER